MKQPNIVWVLTDDQGIGDLGCHGNPWLKTPQLDEFYTNSCHMTNFHVGPTCAPTRSTLMTGHYANSTGVWHTVGGRSLLRENEITIAQVLCEQGYETGIFGKWHLGDSYPYRPEDRGFKKTVIHGGGGISQIPDHWGNDYFDDTYFVNSTPQKFDGYCTDVFFREGMSFISENKDKPFFCFIPANAPHEPHNVPEKYYNMYKDDDTIENNERKKYYGMISNIDENCGKLIEHLTQLNLMEHTIIIFMTDNGTSAGITQNVDSFVVGGYNKGFRGGKNSEYEGGHRTPFFLRYDEAGLNNGKNIDRLTASIDVMPTLLELCGIDASKHEFHGKSIVPLLKNEYFPERVVVTDSQRLTIPSKWRKSAVMTDQWRLINGVELYDINADKEQRNDISGLHTDIVQQLRHEYNLWWNIVSKQFDEEIPIHIGMDENILTAHDLRNMHDISVYRQADVRLAIPATGYWEILVEESGEYCFELRRWPKECDIKLCSGIDENNNDIYFEKKLISKNAHCYYSGGKALELKKAHILIGAVSDCKEVNNDDINTEFTVALSKGNTHLKAWFTDADNLNYGAYYVYVRLLIKLGAKTS